MNELLYQENDNYMYKMIQKQDEIKDKLIKAKHYQKYKEIRKKFNLKIFTYSGLKNLDKFARFVEEDINIFNRYEFQKDIELKEVMNKKQDELKEILEGINIIQILYNNYSITFITKKYLSE